MRRSGRRRRHDERGSAVVDFVMVMFVLLPLFTGILQLCLVLHVRNTLSSAAAEGARRAAVSGATTDDGLAKARDQIIGTVNEDFVDELKMVPVEVDGAPAYKLVIHAKVSTLGLGGPAMAFTVSGTSVLEGTP